MELFFGGVADLVAAVERVAARARPQLVGVFDGFAHGVGGSALGVHLLHPFAQGSLCAAQVWLALPATRLVPPAILDVGACFIHLCYIILATLLNSFPILFKNILLYAVGFCRKLWMLLIVDVDRLLGQCAT